MKIPNSSLNVFPANKKILIQCDRQKAEWKKEKKINENKTRKKSAFCQKSLFLFVFKAELPHIQFLCTCFFNNYFVNQIFVEPNILWCRNLKSSFFKHLITTVCLVAFYWCLWLKKILINSNFIYRYFSIKTGLRDIVLWLNFRKILFYKKGHFFEWMWRPICAEEETENAKKNLRFVLICQLDELT